MLFNGCPLQHSVLRLMRNFYNCPKDPDLRGKGICDSPNRIYQVSFLPDGGKYVIVVRGASLKEQPKSLSCDQNPCSYKRGRGERED